MLKEKKKKNHSLNLPQQNQKMTPTPHPKQVVAQQVRYQEVVVGLFVTRK